jgi:hypothetical protein
MTFDLTLDLITASNHEMNSEITNIMTLDTKIPDDTESYKALTDSFSIKTLKLRKYVE